MTDFCTSFLFPAKPFSRNSNSYSCVLISCYFKLLFLLSLLPFGDRHTQVLGVADVVSCLHARPVSLFLEKCLQNDVTLSANLFCPLALDQCSWHLDQCPNKLIVSWNYNVVFLLVVHKEQTFSLILIWITRITLSMALLQPMSFIRL